MKRKGYMARVAPRARFMVYKSLEEQTFITLRAYTLGMEKTTDSYTTTNSPKTLIRMFLDGTAGEVYNQGRLATVERENDIALVAYGEHILATIDGNNLRFYKNHYGKHSKTVTGYVSDLASLMNDTETRNVTVHSHETPSMGVGSRVAEAGQYIDNFVGDLLKAGRSFSDVEQDAKEQVNSALVQRMSQIFG